MNAHAVLRDAERHGLQFRAEGERLIFGPKDRVSDELREQLRANKPHLMELLRKRQRRPLAERAADLAPTIRFTIRHAGDDNEALDHLRALFRILDEHPGGNLVAIRIVEADGSVAFVERDALADRALRLALAGCIRDRALRLREGNPIR